MKIQCFTTGPLDTNCYILFCEKTLEGIVIDAPLECTSLVYEFIKKHNISCNRIVLTHSHWDHIADIASLKNILKAKVMVHADDATNVAQPGSDGLPLFFPIQGVTPDEYLIEGKTLSVGSIDFLIMHTPGHSPGGICLYSANEHLLIVGDTLFKGAYGNLSLPTSNINDFKTSLKKILALPDETIIYPGHGDSSSIGSEKPLYIQSQT